MIVKKFEAPTETEAVLKAQEELGSNAVVLNVKTLKQRGIFRLFKKDVVEITAALEENEFIGNMNARKQGSKPDDKNAGVQQKQEPKSSFSAVADEKIDIINDSAAIEEKLDSLHDMLRQQIKRESTPRKDIADAYEELSATNEALQADDGRESDARNGQNNNFKFLQLIYNKLLDNEVDEKYANMLIGEVSSSIKKESNIDSLLSGVYQKLILKLGEPARLETGNKPKVVLFIGPTGVGKTTTIAKLASYYKLEKQCKVAFMTADTYRIAAVEQLNTYASIIACPVNVIYSADEVESCLAELEEYDLIFVDTAGRSHKDEEQMLELLELRNAIAGLSDKFELECYLTLSATTKYKDLINITEMYKDIPDYRIIFTKLDETCALGNILNIRLKTGAQLSYTTSGQNVPNDIELINEQSIAKQLLGG